MQGEWEKADAFSQNFLMVHLCRNFALCIETNKVQLTSKDMEKFFHDFGKWKPTDDFVTRIIEHLIEYQVITR
jgi:hypothetical protein